MSNNIGYPIAQPTSNMHKIIWQSQKTLLRGFPGGSVHKEPAGNAEDAGLIPGSGRFPREGNGNPLQYSCLENPMDRGAYNASKLWCQRRLLRVPWTSRRSNKSRTPWTAAHQASLSFSFVSYNPWGHKELDMTQRLNRKLYHLKTKFVVFQS